MYKAREVSEQLNQIRSINSKVAQLIQKLESDDPKVKENEFSEIDEDIGKLMDCLKKDNEYYNEFFEKKVSHLQKVFDDIFKGGILFKSRLHKFHKDLNAAPLINSLKYMNEILITMFNTSNHILGFVENLRPGNPKSPLDQNEITSYEVYGPIRHILNDLQDIVNSWIKKYNLNIMVWVSGSIVDGISPVKGLYQDSEFIAYRPVDYKKLSDIDIGIGLDRHRFGEEMPAYVQGKDVLSVSQNFDSKILALSSLSMDKKSIRKDLIAEHAKKYLDLVNRLENIKLRNVTLKRRGIHLQFFLIDDHLPQSRNLKMLQRKFLIADNFKQPKIIKSNENADAILNGIIMKRLSNPQPELEQEIRDLINSKKLTKKTTKKLANDFSDKYSIAKKRAKKLLDEIVNSNL